MGSAKFCKSFLVLFFKKELLSACLCLFRLQKNILPWIAALADLYISRAEFASLMERYAPWPATQPIAVAVSGGADSLCLGWLAHRWGRAVGLILDHGLRPESGCEAEATARRLTGFGMAARVRRLAIEPGPGVAARARDARYAALTQMAKAEGMVDLLVAHHAGDQAETVLMRRRARSGPAGLAAMAAVTETRDLRIVRPLLSVQPGRLRATLRQAGLGWVEDPSNLNPAALRTRLRQEIAGAVETTGALTFAAGQQAEARASEARETAAVLAERAAIYPQGFAVLSPGPIEAAALAALLRALTGARYPPRLDAVRALAARPRPATCAGVHILSAGRLGPGWLLVREASAMAEAVEAVPGAMWDRRFRVADDSSHAPGTMLGAVGADAARLRDLWPWPAAVLRALPALRLGGRLIGVATEPGGGVEFSPLVPAAGAPFIGVSC
jgi:tRNA(Ile)-lysidine synthase